MSTHDSTGPSAGPAEAARRYHQSINWPARLGREIPRLTEAFGPPGPGGLLDAGCGTGRQATALSEKGFRITALDADGFNLPRPVPTSKISWIGVFTNQRNVLMILIATESTQPEHPTRVRPPRRRFPRPALLCLCATLLAPVGAASEESGDAPLTASTEDVEATAAPTTGNKGVIITVTDMITDVTTESIKRRTEAAKETGVDVIVFEINTEGGLVTSALDICNYIKNLEDIKTIAWINTDAYSAGSMIAVACDEIVMARASVLGDCGVILGGPMGVEEVPEQLRAKAESPVLEQFRDSAQRNGYDVLLCDAMVIKEHEVYWIESIETGERRFVDAETKGELCDEGEKRKVFGIEVPGTTESKPQWRLVKTYDDPITGPNTKIKQPVVSTTELLTLSQSRAQAFGFSKGIVTNQSDLRQRYALTGTIERVDFTRSEVLTRWMTSMPVRGFLLVIILLGAYVEFNTPGVGVAGLVALIALGIFLAAPYLTGLANAWEILLIIVGFVLLGLEVFVIPGFGIAGLGGVVLVLIGLLATFMPDEPGRWPIYWPSLAPSMDALKSGVQTMAGALGVSIVGMFLLSKYFPQMPYLRSIVPENPTPAEVTSPDPYHGLARVGDVGMVTGDLRPSGKARFGAILVDVVTEGEMIDQNVRVEVIERHGNRVVVRTARNV